jgi:protein-disulfide isomerase
MHDALFARVEHWTAGQSERAFLEPAAVAGLDLAGFKACFDGRNALERVVGDLYDAQDIVRTTPSFVIVEGEVGSLTGPLPADQFLTLLLERLDRLEQSPGRNEAAP